MRQTIDFYGKLDGQKSVSSSLAWIGISWIALLSGYLAWMIVLNLQEEKLERSLNELGDTNKQLEREIAVEVKKSQQDDLGILEAKLRDLRAQQYEQQLLIDQLRTPSFSNLDGFSATLEGLARQHRKGISVEKIEMTESGTAFHMSGKVRHPMDVPAYIVRLGDEEVFEDMAFEKIVIGESASGLTFEVRSWTNI